MHKSDSSKHVLTSALGSYGSFTYQYNPIGNMTQKEGRSLSYGGAGKPVHAVTSTSDGYSYHYDLNGNLTQKTAPSGGAVYRSLP